MMNEEKNEMSNEFLDVVQENKNSNYIFVIVLYIVIVILAVLLFWGLKLQKETIIENNNIVSYLEQR